MATVTKFVDNTQYVEDLSTRAIVIQNTLDFSAVNVSAADVVQALKVPVDCLIHSCSSYVITAEGATCTADLGDDADPNGFDDAVNLNSAGGYYSVDGTDAYSVGKFYSAANTIDLTMDHDTDAAKIHIVALGVKLNADLA